MEKERCPRIDKCPIFRKNMFLNDKSQRTFRMVYCEAGSERFSACKRFRAAMLTKVMIPENILPNSGLSIDKIVMITQTSLN